MTNHLTTKNFLRVSALLLGGLATMCTSAYADPIYSYSFTLTPYSTPVHPGDGDNVSGTLILGLAAPIPSTGDLSGDQVVSLLATLSNGDVYTLANASAGTVDFVNGVVNSFDYSVSAWPPPYFTLDIENGHFAYEFQGDQNSQGSNYTAGTVIFNGPVSAATPEPSSLILLGTGLLGIAGVARRKLLAR